MKAKTRADLSYCWLLLSYAEWKTKNKCPDINKTKTTNIYNKNKNKTYITKTKNKKQQKNQKNISMENKRIKNFRSVYGPTPKKLMKV
jgi:hypothetical protein